MIKFARAMVLKSTPRISFNSLLLSKAPVARVFSTTEDTKVDFHGMIGDLKDIQSLGDFLQKEGNNLAKEDLCLVLEQLAALDSSSSSHIFIVSFKLI